MLIHHKDNRLKCRYCNNNLNKDYNFSEYVYKCIDKTAKRTVYFCRWNCYRKYLKENNLIERI